MTSNPSPTTRTSSLQSQSVPQGRPLKPVIDWHYNVQRCTKCDISKFCGPKITLRHSLSPVDLDVLFVGEAPGASEHSIQAPFVGPAGHELDAIIEYTIRSLSSTHKHGLRYNIINAVLCTPFKDADLDTIRTPSLSEVKECRTHLKAYLDISKPKLLIALGKVAERTCKELRTPYVTTLHPSAILQSSHPELERKRAILTINQALSKHFPL